MSTVAAYIDGFNLYYAMKAKYRRKYLWLDVVDLVRRLRPDDQVVAVRYFTTMIHGDGAAARNQAEYVAALKAYNGFGLDVHLGRFKIRTIRSCFTCGEPYLSACGLEFQSHEEKETDVAIGAMMVADAALGVADTSLLVTGDTDLRPALTAVRLVVPDQRLYVALPAGHGRPSQRLLSVGNLGYFVIRESVLNNAQLPEVVHDPVDGRAIRRPEKWR
ncbi:NYN domain-containing protein [Paractinoplanes durhamensis]|uniref:NYN domain-containing protein n=1 Tax=Paractinoplanes durhamensis TaxID=113563 RepID=A0ABQ3YPV3_9ACTN|nr:NYN domain-containing protein [Actinoplanes durhamensis]GID99614.1 hypothetical protein Adu01nite_09650 [Actinoplanes durhamensis]